MLKDPEQQTTTVTSTIICYQYYLTNVARHDRIQQNNILLVV